MGDLARPGPVVMIRFPGNDLEETLRLEHPPPAPVPWIWTASAPTRVARWKGIDLRTERLCPAACDGSLRSVMSQAFIREPDAPEPRCPAPSGCGGLGQSVTRASLVANVGEEAALVLGEELFFCPDPDCEVAYFDATGGRVGVDRLLERRWPKSLDAPLCACFGVTLETIASWAREGRTDQMKAFLERAQGPEARCLSRTHAGRSCVLDARRVFVREKERPAP